MIMKCRSSCAFLTTKGLVQDNNIYWLDKVAGNLHTITNNGKENEVYNGVPDWVYEGKYINNLTTVPTIVIAHMFCTSRDTWISYRRCILVQGYFCAVQNYAEKAELSKGS